MYPLRMGELLGGENPRIWCHSAVSRNILMLVVIEVLFKNPWSYVKGTQKPSERTLGDKAGIT